MVSNDWALVLVSPPGAKKWKIGPNGKNPEGKNKREGEGRGNGNREMEKERVMERRWQRRTEAKLMGMETQRMKGQEESELRRQRNWTKQKEKAARRGKTGRGTSRG